MNRRAFLQTQAGMVAATAVGVARAETPNETPKLALGFDNFSLRSWGWKAPRLLDYAAEQKCDALLFSDLDVYENHSAGHLSDLKKKANDLEITLHSGTGGICPTSAAFKDTWGTAEEHLTLAIQVAKRLGSPVVRCYLGKWNDRTSAGGIRARIADTIAVLKSVRTRALDAGVMIAIENHAGDMQAHELRDLIEEAGKEYVGATIDAGNAAWTLEDPLVNLKILAPYAVSSGIRDTMVWNTEEGAFARWTSIGEGNVDLAAYFKMFAEQCANVPVILEIISEYGRPFPWRTPKFWKAFPESRASEFARFVALAESGKAIAPFDPPGEGDTRKKAVKKFQKEQLEKSFRVCREKFGIGRKN